VVGVQDVMANRFVIAEFWMIDFPRQSRHEVVRIVEGPTNSQWALLRLLLPLWGSPLLPALLRCAPRLRRTGLRNGSSGKRFSHGPDADRFATHHFQIDLDLVLGPVSQ
jgi:hypothetical protein